MSRNARDIQKTDARETRGLGGRENEGVYKTRNRAGTPRNTPLTGQTPPEHPSLQKLGKNKLQNRKNLKYHE